ncbi:hypothetical protein [Xylanimonas protaetiae]|uniref:ATP synthase subunit I n=1 Tax=Xylanimonas protaetiae TaxID=2509457 RepID=A0A4P6FDZ4_9MICO|nr:hypothetical protein [Xylanimonas protaetiae]QAY68818.1 hypothetical protein ET471_01110 [Xylanimonas protaetiae]
MTNAPTPTPDPHAPERQVFRSALRATLLLLGGLTVVGVVVGLLVSGTQGVWGAVIGVLLAGFFCATTIWSLLRTVGSSPTAMAGFVMGSWMVKIVVLVVVLAVLRGRDFFDPYVLFGVVAVGAIGSAVLDYRAVTRGRIPYVQP